MTLPLLKLIGHQIAISDWTPDSKQVIWTCLLIAFFGSLRMGEILSIDENEFNKFETLLWDDVSFREDGSILLKIKITKTRNPHGESIDLFPFDGHKCCPVKALKNLFKRRTLEQKVGKPVFAFYNGKLLTSGKINNILPILITPHMGSAAASEYKAHSFRAGIPSAISEHPEIANIRELKSWGRWSSDSYLLYTRLKINQKKDLWKMISAVLK